MISIQQRLIQNRINRPALRDGQKYAIRSLRGIVAHWTANPNKGADAAAHQRFFNNVPTYTSAHYFVDDHQIIQAIPDSEIAYHVGAKTYKTDGLRIIGDSVLTANYYLIGFEMCVNSDGNWGKTYINAVDLAAHLLDKYRFGLNDLYRHFDITGKDCPQMFLSNSAWEKFRSDIGLALLKLSPPILRTARVTSPGLNVRRGPSSRFGIVKSFQLGAIVPIVDNVGIWQKIGHEQWVHGAYLETVAITQDGLINSKIGANVRSGPSVRFEVVDTLPFGAWVSVLGKDGNWYQIGENRWVYSSLIDIVKVDKEEVTGTSFLNVRRGPGTRYDISRVLRRGDMVEVFERMANWKRISADEWVYGGFLK